jgi:hypothetical protein
MMNFKYKNITPIIGMVLIATMFGACKKYPNPPQVFEEYGDGSQGAVERKVLVINIEGVVGSELKAINPANMTALIKNGKYTYSEISEAVSTEAGTMASLLTGVASSKHKITDDSYSPTVTGNEHAEIVNYPTVFSRLLDVRPEFKTVTATTDPALNRYLIHSDHRILAASDVAVKDSTVNTLQKENARVYFADFRDVEKAGSTGGYTATVPAYKAAIEKVDGYVGEIMDALKKRKNFATEDWLVIVTTNRGGSATSPKQGFAIYYNPSFKQYETRIAGFNTMRFVGLTTFGSIKNDNGLYDAGATKDFTVQFQVKFNTQKRYPGFFSKSTGVDGTVSTGWIFLQDMTNYGVVLGGSANGGTGKTQISGTGAGDGKWHTVTLTVKLVAGVRTATLYTDGIVSGSANITGTKSLSTPNPMKIGYNRVDASTDADIFMADIQYFGVALDATVIKDNIALKDITKHPQFANLLGFWRMDDGGGAVLSNSAPTGYNFLMEGSGKWASLGTDVPLSRTPENIPDGQLSIVATVPDLPAQLFYWLKVPVKSEWGLDGINWISKFELEFIK